MKTAPFLECTLSKTSPGAEKDQTPRVGLVKQFSELYVFAERVIQRRDASGQQKDFPEGDVRTWLLRNRAVDVINFYEVPAQTGDPLGYFRLKGRRADVHTKAGLTPQERRYVRLKEMMHCFDEDDQKVHDQPRFRTLLNDLSFEPLERHPVSMSEQVARWSALLVAMPKPFRDVALQEWQAGEREAENIARSFGLPEHAARAALSANYDKAFEMLLDSNRSA